MGKVARRVSIGIGILFGLVVLAAAWVAFFFDVNRYKPQIEAAASKSTGMQLKILGNASVKILPRIRVTLDGVHLANRGSEIFEARTIELMPQILPLVLHRELIVSQVALEEPKIHVEKSAGGRMNYETAAQKPSPPKGGTGATAGKVGSLKIHGGDLTYLDRASGITTRASGVDGTLSDISWEPGNSGSAAAKSDANSVSFKGQLAAKSVQYGKYSITDVQSGIRDQRGLIQLDPTSASAFGGSLRGSARIDLRGAKPKFNVIQTATRIDVAQLPATAGQRLVGHADASVNLAAAGKSSSELLKSSEGAVSIRSRDLKLVGVDIDQLAGRLKSAQGTDLAQLGSSVFSGALSGALAPTPGQSAGIAGRLAGGETTVRFLVSDWKIHGGVAEAQDVAISTPKSTVAFKGGINLVNRTYRDFYVATVDPQGCSKQKIEITGPIAHPRPTKESVGRELSRSILGQAENPEAAIASGLAGIVGGSPPKPEAKPQGTPAPQASPQTCDHFYSGAALRVG